LEKKRQYAVEVAQEANETREEKQKEVIFYMGAWCNPASLWAPVKE